MQKRTAEEVEKLLKGYEESGLSRQEFCQRERIPVTTLDYYRGRSTRKAAGLLLQFTFGPDPIAGAGAGSNTGI